LAFYETIPYPTFGLGTSFRWQPVESDPGIYVVGTLNDMHHHLMEYPMSVSAFSERVGTALINGSWFVRRLRSFAARAIVMHGHRHIDWTARAAS
jgi:hypothetical protein